MNIKRLPPAHTEAELWGKVNDLVDAVNDINGARRRTRVNITKDVMERIVAVMDQKGMSQWGVSLDMGLSPGWFTQTRQELSVGYTRKINQETYEKIFAWLKENERDDENQSDQD